MTAMIGPDGRRLAEQRHARAGLRAEWEHWYGLAAANGPLEKHNTQIRSIVDQLATALDELGERDDDRHERLLDLHHVWDFFRVKLALRLVAPLRPFLDAADEVAWTVYRPAVDAAGLFGVTLREPPLVYLDRSAVPFATARGSSYRDLLPRGVRTRTGAAAARGLPFPVIGIPWYSSSHLPAAVLVAHEVGHHIEDDCRLTAELVDRTAHVGSGRWTNWLGEIFADIVGTLSCGSAYLATLSDALAAAPDDGAAADPYPPWPVRIQICRATLRCAAETTSATAGTEVEMLVAAVLREPWAGLGGRTLVDVLQGPLAEADGGADRLLKGLASTQTDVRAVIAAAALAFARDPAAYDDRQVDRRAVTEILNLRPVGVRGLTIDDKGSRRERDRSAGGTFLGILRDGAG